MTRLRVVLGGLVLAGAGAAVTACSSASPAPESGQASSDLQLCFGSVCIDADVPGFDAATPQWPDAGITWPDAGAGFTWPDAGAGIAWPDGGAGFTWDAAIPPWTFDAGITYCDWTNAKYGHEYNTALASGQLKPCFAGCAATECCYMNLSCVAQ